VPEKAGRKDIIKVAAGNDKGLDFESQESGFDVEERENLLQQDAEEDFAYLNHQLDQGDKDWHAEAAFSSDSVQVFRKHTRGWSNVTLKTLAHLDHIPKHIVLKAIADMNLRAKWDSALGQVEVLEHKKEQDQTFVRLNLNKPHHMLAREAVLVRKVLKDFPQIHMNSVVLRSSPHARCPENHRESVRVDTRMNGFILEDDESQRGTKLKWFFQTDLKGSLPHSILTHMHLKYQQEFMAALVKACHQIVKGNLK